MSTYTKVCLQLQSLFTKDTERQTGKPGWRILLVQKKIPRLKESPKLRTHNPPQASKINIYKTINKYSPMHIALTTHIIVPIFPRANFVTQSNLWVIGLATTRLPAEQTLSVDEQTRV